MSEDPALAQPSAAPASPAAPSDVERLFREHNAALLCFISAKTGSEQEAREIAQEAYVHLLQLHHPETVSYLRAFLFKTAANLAIDRLRQRARRTHVTSMPEVDFAAFELTPERQLLTARFEIEMMMRVSRATRRLPSQLTIVFLSNIAGLLLVALLTASRVHAEGAAASGTEPWDRLGCWTCHGSEGAGSRQSGTAIAKTSLPLRRFVGRVRLPIWQMPPFAPQWAPDADLAIIYRWLEGADDVRIPPAITIELKSAPAVKADGPPCAQVEIEMTVLRIGTALNSEVGDFASLQYRVTLITNSSLPVANRTLEYRLAGLEDWSKFTLNEDGEALLGQEHRFIVANERDPGKARARLRMALPAVRTVVVIEALDYAQPAKPVIVGIGTATLNQR